jgi:hypothetical protein
MTEITKVQAKNLLEKVLEANGDEDKIRSVFKKYFPENAKNKSLKSKEPSENKSKKDPKNDSKNSFKITMVSDGLKSPGTLYKKPSPIEAAKSAADGIVKKNKLGGDAKFKFEITKKDDEGSNSYWYLYSNGKVERIKKDKK